MSWIYSGRTKITRFYPHVEPIYLLQVQTLVHTKLQYHKLYNANTLLIYTSIHLNPKWSEDNVNKVVIFVIDNKLYISIVFR